MKQKNRLGLKVGLAMTLLLLLTTGTLFASAIVKNMSKEQASQIAQASVEGEVIEVSEDTYGEKDVYEVELAQSSGNVEVIIDAASEEILKIENEEAEEESIDLDPQKVDTSVSLEEAKTLALAAVEGKVTDTELEKEFGRTVFEIEVWDGSHEHDVHVDAFTGEIVAIEKD